jgi:uncharacterized protein
MPTRPRLILFVAVVGMLCTVPLAWGSDLRIVEAAKKQDPAAIAALIKQHADVNAPLPDGATALHWATYWDEASAVDVLIRAGARVNAANEDGATPLYLACINRNATIAEKLLAAGADPNGELPSGETALMTATRTGSTAIVRALLARKANVNAKEKTSGQTALMWAVAYEHADVAKALLDADASTSARSDVRRRVVNVGGLNQSERKPDGTGPADLGGFTPLLFAARNGNVELGKVLLTAGANVNEAGPTGASALAIAAHSGNTAFASFLLEHGADPNAAGAGFTPMHAAVLRSDVALVKALLDKGADPNAELTKGTPTRYESHDYYLNGGFVGATPYWLAARYGEAEIMKVLAARGADPKHLTKDGTSPILTAVSAKSPGQIGDVIDRRGRMDTPTEFAARPKGEDEQVTLAVALLACEAGVDPNLPNMKGNVALIEAATRGYESVVQMLLARGANVNATNKNGDTALHLAAQSGYDSIIRLLVAKGADIDIKNRKGQTALAMTSTSASGASGYLGYIVPEAKLKAAQELLAQLGAKQ